MVEAAAIDALRVFFIDDDTHVLDALRRCVQRVRRGWQIEVASSAIEGMRGLASHPFDVVVTDLHMPTTDGVSFLADVQREWPQCLRVVLTADSQSQRIYRAMGIAHRVLGKPATADSIVAAIEGALRIRHRLFDTRVLQAVSGIGSLPTPPRVYQAIEAALRDDRSLAEIGAILGSDPGLASKVLQIANSAWFGLRRRVESPAQAIAMLGVTHLKNLILSVGLAQSLIEPGSSLAERLERLAMTAGRVAATSQQLALAARMSPDDCEAAFSAGVLMSIGDCVIAARLPAESQAVLDALSADPTACRKDVERRIIGATHAEIGALLLSMWGVPDPIVRVTCEQQDEPDAFGPVATVVRVAELLVTGASADPDAAQHLTALEPCIQRYGLALPVANYLATSGQVAPELLGKDR